MNDGIRTFRDLSAWQHAMAVCRDARGSLFEIETQLLIAVEIGYLVRESFRCVESKLHECGRVLTGLLRSVETSVSGTDA